jgi:phosphatidylinositol alpha-1,6-mannosyltransferase
MRVVVATEMRVARTPDGRVWANGGPGYDFWRRYLEAFEQVRVVARACSLPTRPDRSLQVDGDGVEVWPVVHYIGPWQYAARRSAVRASAVSAIGADDAVLLRVPSPIGTILANHCEQIGQRYSLEVVGDPREALSRRAVKHPLRPLIQRWATTCLRRQCTKAEHIAYVTEDSLQRRYPPSPGKSWSFSDVHLPEQAFVSAPRNYATSPAEPRLISVGSLEQLYKGIDTLIEAIALLRRQGRQVGLTHIGDGRYLPHLNELAHRRGVGRSVDLVGAVSGGEKIRGHLDGADLFVQPSRAEGLPRALIEAMARSLPAVASSVGGIPELLPNSWLVPPNNARQLADCIIRALDVRALSVASKVNLDRARCFGEAFMRGKYIDFYAAIRTSGDRRRSVVN